MGGTSGTLEVGNDPTRPPEGASHAASHLAHPSHDHTTSRPVSRRLSRKRGRGEVHVPPDPPDGGHPPPGPPIGFATAPGQVARPPSETLGLLAPRHGQLIRRQEPVPAPFHLLRGSEEFAHAAHPGSQCRVTLTASRCVTSRKDGRPSPRSVGDSRKGAGVGPGRSGFPSLTPSGPIRPASGWKA